MVAVDTHGTWNPSDVAFGKYENRFKVINEDIPNFNFTTYTYWIKFEVINVTKNPATYYIETARPITNLVALYGYDSLSSRSIFKTGDEFKFEDRPLTYRKFVFPIRLQPNQSRKFMLQARSDGEVLTMPIKMWSPNNFYSYIQRENLTLGIYYGLLLFVIGLFLFFAIVVQQKIYTAYVAYVALLLLMQASLDGLTFEYFWPTNTWLANHSILIFSSASVLMMMLYAGFFLKITTLGIRFKYFYLTLLVLVTLCMFSGMTEGITYELTYPAINGLSLIALLTIIMAIIWMWIQKQEVNLLFALAFFSVLLGGIAFILTNFNFIESEFLAKNAIKVGSAMEVTFLSLAMAARYREIQREKIQAQIEAYSHLERLNEVTKNQKERLEKIVVQRTTEIRKTSQQLEEKNKEIIDSITYAKRIQEAILPSDEYFYQQLPKSFVLYLPKDIVAGDFYWMELMGNKVLFAAADCTGHGVPGAMVSVVCNNALTRAVREYGLSSPADILDVVAIMVEENFKNSVQQVKDGMDISLCAYDPATHELEWAGANNPIWIVTKRDLSDIADRHLEYEGDESDLHLYEIKGDKQPIGSYAHRVDFTNHKIQLEKGDRVYVFSDGFADQFGGEKGKKYKTRRFKEFVLRIQDHEIHLQKDIFLDEFRTWQGDLQQLDDVCVIGFAV